MRIRAGLVAALLIFSASSLATAEETKPSVGDPASPPIVQKSKAERLDELFATLQSANSAEAAKTAESAILRLWLASGSDTVDLMMVWAIRAMDKKNYPLALDFLDRIVSMKPDYAEGWNKRATVYFLVEDYGKSIQDIGRTLELEPRHFGALAGLGMIMRDLGDEKRAMEAYRRALTVDPHLGNVKKQLDDLETKTGGSPI